MDVLCRHHDYANEKTKVWNNPYVTHEEKNALYSEMYDSMDTIHKELSKKIYDPTGKSRKVLFLAMVMKYFLDQK